jgi:nitroimidazol reductase NimA-like FMN-containing flavoprotein (pyridoxamine 5'-phosphate oxidase superfamily)
MTMATNVKWPALTPEESPKSPARMTKDECVALLKSERVGRIAFMLDGQIEIAPVNYTLFEDAVLIRSAPGKKLRSAQRHSGVAFEVDTWAPDGSTGASVVVHGHARELTLGGEAAKALAVPMEAWAFSHPPEQMIRIDIELLTGRKFGSVSEKSDVGQTTS